jgi:hypothetical protein
MQFSVKRTNELSTQEKESIRDLFLEVFEKDKTADQFERQFSKNPFGYSYHGLMKNELNQIVGSYTCIPCRYEVAGKLLTLGLSVDTMIKKSARGNLSNLKVLAETVYSRLIEDGIPMVFGFPNTNIYAVRKRFLKWRDIGELDYHILPLRPDRKKRWLKPLRPFFLLAAALLNLFAFSGKNSFITENNALIKKINDSQFQKYRYDSSHQFEKLGLEGFFYHTVSDFEGAKVALLMDVEPLTSETVQSAVSKIYKLLKNEVDAIVYIGKLGACPINLFRLPQRLAPKPVRMAGRILIPEIIGAYALQLDSWRINLSDFDIG